MVPNPRLSETQDEVPPLADMPEGPIESPYELSETQEEVPPLLDTPEEKQLLEDPIASPSTEDNDIDDSSKLIMAKFLPLILRIT